MLLLTILRYAHNIGRQCVVSMALIPGISRTMIWSPLHRRVKRKRNLRVALTSIDGIDCLRGEARFQLLLYSVWLKPSILRSAIALCLDQPHRIVCSAQERMGQRMFVS